MAVYTTGPTTFYNAFREALGDGRVDLDGDTFKAVYCTSSYTPDVENDVDIGDISNELSGSGYARVTISATWTRSTDTVTFDAADWTLAASGGDLTFRYILIWDETADILVAYFLANNTPGNVTITDGNTGATRPNASGIFTLSDAA